MASMSPGTALRQLQQAQAGMKKARQALLLVRGNSEDQRGRRTALTVGWDSLGHAHRLLGSIPLEAASEPVMSKQIAVQRYATALLVRLRRLARNESGGHEDLEEDIPEDG